MKVTSSAHWRSLFSVLSMQILSQFSGVGPNGRVLSNLIELKLRAMPEVRLKT